jgi:dolichol-phosphate mannosyltransferase
MMDSMGTMLRLIAMLPTYNEYGNIRSLVDALLRTDPRIEVLVVDDDSPDGTWEIVRDLAGEDPRIHLLHRTTERGRGSAGIAGFREAVRLGADAVVEMDADWSHDPKWIPSMIECHEKGADVVIGSRLVPGGGESGRHWLRPMITWCANLYIRLVLGLKVRDSTSGFRLFSGICVKALPWDRMCATGPETVQEILYAAHRRGFDIREIPITFVERRHGESTFNSKIMLRSLAAIWRLRFRQDRQPADHEPTS